MEPTKTLFNLKAKLCEMIDVDMLIELVKTRPVIWDRTVEGYRNRDILKSTWDDILRCLLNTFHSLNVEQKKFIGKVIKDKWTSIRDLWLKAYRKRKEAMQRGENVNDAKYNARNEKLMFLTKVYDNDKHLQTEKKDKILDKTLGNRGNLLFSTSGLDGQNIPNFNIANLQPYINILMSQKTPEKKCLKLSSKKKKLENISVTSAQSKKHKIVCHDSSDESFGKKLKLDSLSSASKQQKSSIENSKNTPAPGQVHLLKCEKTSPRTFDQEMPSNNLSLNINTSQTPQTLVVRSHSQLLHQEYLKSPGTINYKNARPQLINNAIPKHEVSETKVELTPGNSPSSGSDTTSTISEVDRFFQVLRPCIIDFSKTQMIDLFLEILKPHIKDFDKHQLLDFQIKSLQLIKKKSEQGIN